MKHDFTEWTQSFKRSQAKVRFFRQLFETLEKRQFTLQNPDAIPGGYRLEFVKDAAYVMVDRYTMAPVAGETEGVSLYHDTRSWEAVFSALTPFTIVSDAIEFLTADEDA